MTKKIINIVIHCRGGQGGVTASQILAEAAYLSGSFKDVLAYPSFGAERRGAPIQAYAKLSKEETIWDRSEISNPDILLIFDESLLNQDITSSLKKEGFLIINSEKEPDFFEKKFDLSENIRIIVADISKLALDNNLLIESIPVVNIPILGMLSKALPELNLEDLKKIIQERMKDDLGKRNIELMEQAYNLAKTL